MSFNFNVTEKQVETVLQITENFEEQQKFRSEIADQLWLIISNDKKFCEVQKDHLQSIEKYLLEIVREGCAIIEGKDEVCRPVHVGVQGALETLLAQRLKSSESKTVETLILTPLPPTPLRKVVPESFEESRRFTIEQREFTLRELIKSGGYFIAAYSKKKYDELKNENEKHSYEKEKKTLFDVPLKKEVPAELVGALYTFNGWILATQGIQAQEAKDGKWTMWLEPVQGNGEGNKRAEMMKQFVKENGI